MIESKYASRILPQPKITIYTENSGTEIQKK